jgi:alpha-tubulin suppressor-like RCC1 family protein
VFVDSKNRVFSMGSGKHGRLGHGNEKDKLKPKMIEGLKGKNIIDL